MKNDIPPVNYSISGTSEEGRLDDINPEWFTNHYIPWWGCMARKWLQINGPLPRHVAFIMDGNRRFAKTHSYVSVLEGHSHGFAKLTQVLDWCRELNVREVTFYAFSIENFKRSNDEINALMEMAEKKFELLLHERPALAEHQIRFRFFGDLALLPKKLQQLCAEIELFTHDFDQGSVNICLAYTAQNEIVRAMEYIRRGVQLKLIEERDVNEWLISKSMDTRNSLEIDLLIRTSGENRLSDFLLWQCSNTYIHVDKVLWPEFTFKNLFKAFRAYQKNRKPIQHLNSTIAESLTPGARERAQKFLDWMEKDRRQSLEVRVQNRPSS